MKTFATHFSQCGDIRRRRAAFTLIEILITTVITILVVGAILGSYMYGMRMFQVVKPKLNASDDARQTISKMIQEIRAAGAIAVGSGSYTKFTPAPINGLQAGNVIQIYPLASSTNQFVRYYLDPNDDALKRISSGDTNAQILALDVTNAVPFTAEDFSAGIARGRRNYGSFGRLE